MTLLLWCWWSSSLQDEVVVHDLSFGNISFHLLRRHRMAPFSASVGCCCCSYSSCTANSQSSRNVLVLSAIGSYNGRMCSLGQIFLLQKSWTISASPTLLFYNWNVRFSFKVFACLWFPAQPSPFQCINFLFVFFDVCQVRRSGILPYLELSVLALTFKRYITWIYLEEVRRFKTVLN